MAELTVMRGQGGVGGGGGIHMIIHRPFLVALVFADLPLFISCYTCIGVTSI